MEENANKLHFIASNIVIHPQSLICFVFKIEFFSILIANKIFMSLVFYLLTSVINLWHRKFVTADITAVFVDNQHGMQ